MKRSALYIWHNDNPLSDEVRLLPEGTSEDDARCLALLMMSLDTKATHIDVVMAKPTSINFDMPLAA